MAEDNGIQTFDDDGYEVVGTIAVSDELADSLAILWSYAATHVPSHDIRTRHAIDVVLQSVARHFTAEQRARAEAFVKRVSA